MPNLSSCQAFNGSARTEEPTGHATSDLEFWAGAADLCDRARGREIVRRRDMHRKANSGAMDVGRLVLVNGACMRPLSTELLVWVVFGNWIWPFCDRHGAVVDWGVFPEKANIGCDKCDLQSSIVNILVVKLPLSEVEVWLYFTAPKAGV
jgi:hypothetical protein